MNSKKKTSKGRRFSRKLKASTKITLDNVIEEVTKVLTLQAELFSYYRNDMNMNRDFIVGVMEKLSSLCGRVNSDVVELDRKMAALIGGEVSKKLGSTLHSISLHAANVEKLANTFPLHLNGITRIVREANEKRSAELAKAMR